MQQQFHIQKAQAKVDSFTPRAEKNGKKATRPAGTLKMTLTAHSLILDAFHPAFRPFLFRRPNPGEQQTNDLTEVNSLKIEPLRLSEKFPGYGLQIESGLEMGEATALDKVELSQFVFKPLKGGSVQISLQANCHPEGEGQFDALCKMIQQDVEITLIPPAQAQGSLDLSASTSDDNADDDEDADDESDDGEASEEEQAAERARLAGAAASDDGEEE